MNINNNITCLTFHSGQLVKYVRMTSFRNIVRINSLSLHTLAPVRTAGSNE